MSIVTHETSSYLSETAWHLEEFSEASKLVTALASLEVITFFMWHR